MLVLRVGNFDEIGRRYGRNGQIRASIDCSDRTSSVRMVISSPALPPTNSDYLPGTTTENARDICERIRARIDETTFKPGKSAIYR